MEKQDSTLSLRPRNLIISSLSISEQIPEEVQQGL